MAGLKLLRWAHIEHDRFPGAYQLQQLFALHRPHVIALVEMVAHDTLDFGGLALCHMADAREHRRNLVVAQTIDDLQTFLARDHQPCVAQGLQMVRRVRD